MSRRLLKFSCGSVTQFLTWSRFQGRVSEMATAYTALGVRPSNRCGHDVYLCCAPTMPTAALGDGRVGLLRANRVSVRPRPRMRYAHRGEDWACCAWCWPLASSESKPGASSR